MAKLEHFSHECTLTSTEMVAEGVCNICHDDEPIDFGCKPCNFDVCKGCSKLPRRVSHDFHSQHPLEFCLRQYDQEPGYIICSGCGNMSSASFYECKQCEIYLDLDCAILENIFSGWNAKEMLHYSHCHLLKRCRPGADATGSCLLCELPLPPSAICYGCVHCYKFFHERCLDLPTKIQHPVHPTHVIHRLSYIHTCGGGRNCNACGGNIAGVPFGCLECNFNLHMRCADSLLRGLMHRSHEHRLFYVAGKTWKRGPCQICMSTDMISLGFYYCCVECKLKFHFKCLEIPEYVFKKSFHIHPLVCKIFQVEEDSLEYCGVCETVVHAGHHAYCCRECDFLGHIECILGEKTSPLYLKHLQSFGEEDIMGPTDQKDCESNIVENELTVNGIQHIHVMREVCMGELDERAECNICSRKIIHSPCKCETCNFQTHRLCAELGKPSRYRVHWNHSLILLPRPPVCFMMTCDSCKNYISGFNLFCRTCNFIMDIKCALKGKHSLGKLGEKVIGTSKELCMSNNHNMVQVKISRSYPTTCSICLDMLCGTNLSCMTCGEIYHPRCFEFGKQGLYGHPLHSYHTLLVSLKSGSKCIVCKLKITKYGYACLACDINFHFECIKAVDVSSKIWSHSHNLYNFWADDSRSSQSCSVCGRPCGASFYGCLECNFNAHVKCIGFPSIVKNQQHQHTVREFWSFSYGICSICGSVCTNSIYTCSQCNDVFHTKCIMKMDDREATTQENQIQDIYLMYLQRDLFDLLNDSVTKYGSASTL